METTKPLPDLNLDYKTPATCQNCRFWTRIVKHNPDDTIYNTEECKYGLLPPPLGKHRRYERAEYCVAHQPATGNPFD